MIDGQDKEPDEKFIPIDDPGFDPDIPKIPPNDEGDPPWKPHHGDDDPPKPKHGPAVDPKPIDWD